MKLSYFSDTDTLYMEFKGSETAERQELDANILLDLDAEGNVVALTLEHASARTDLEKLTLSGIAA